MNIQELTDRIKEICLNEEDIKSFHVGNTWDMSASKSSDIYPAVWIEFPILITYEAKDKVYTFSMDVLMLPKQDDVWDELNKQSQAEAIADILLQVFKLKIKNLSVNTADGLTVKNLNSDIACGVRVDLKFIVGRECDPLAHFNETMDRL
jgi:hypothetical protein